MKLADAIATAPRRTLKGTYWHQGPTRHPVTSCADPARGPGRYHRTGEPGVWYASNKEQGAWAELFRHFVDDGVDPFEVRRRVGRVAVTLQVLDLTDERTRSHLGVDETDLLSDDYTTTQAIAAARDANFDAVLAPAAALPGCQTLAVFVHALPNIEPERSEVRQPPPRLANLLPADPSARTHARLRAQIACNADTCRSRSNPAPTTLKASRPDGL